MDISDFEVVYGVWHFIKIKNLRQEVYKVDSLRHVFQRHDLVFSKYSSSGSTRKFLQPKYASESGRLTK